MITGSEKNFSEALLNEQPRKKVNLQLKDGSVTTSKISDKAITLDKLGDDVTTELFRITVDEELSSESENPVQNKAISVVLEQKEDLVSYMTNSELNVLWNDVFYA